MAIVRGESFEDAFEGPFDPDVVLSGYLLDLCEAVHCALERSGMTQSDLACKLGKKPSQVSRILSGEANVTLRTIAELDSVLELKLEIRPRRKSNEWFPPWGRPPLCKTVEPFFLCFNARLAALFFQDPLALHAFPT